MSLTDKLAAIARGRHKSAVSSSTSLSRGLGRLDAGTHEVRIESVNTSCLATRGFVDLVYGDTQERTHRDRLWILARNSDQLSWRLQQLLTALFDSSSQWLEALELNQEQAFHLLRGMQLTVTLEQGPGYQIQQSPTGWQAVASGQVIATAQSVKETHDKAQAAGYQRSWLRTKGVTSGGHLDVNQQALNNAITALSKAAIAEPVSLEAHLRRLGADTTG